MSYMDRSARRVLDCERLFTARRHTRRAIALALRYWQRGRLASSKTDIDQAYHTAATMLQYNPGSAELYLLCAFLCVERNDTDTATEYMAVVKPFRAGWKQTSPFLYGAELYLQARIALLEDKDRAAKKHYKSLDEYNETHRVLALDMLLGELDLHREEYAAAFAFLNYASLSGATSPFLYVAAHWYFRDAPGESPEGALLPMYLRWALTQTLDLTDVLTQRQEECFAIVSEHPALGKRLYAAYSQDWILDALCDRMLDNKDMSESAFYYYKEAEAKQLYSPRLNDYLILSAYRNSIESISRYSLTRYLDGGNPDAALKPFIYHLLLTTPEYAPLASRVEHDILQCGCHCLENRLTGRMYYSLYCFMLQKAEENVFTDTALIHVAESLVQHALFTYEVTMGNPSITHLWVFEKEKKESRAYEVRDGVVQITAASAQFTAHCFADGMRRLPETTLHRRRLAENVDYGLYLRFFRTGFISTELLIVLTRFCLAMEALPDEALPVLEAAMTDMAISRLFRMRAAAALGNHYARSGDYTNAAACYKDLDENALEDRDVEQMLLVQIHIRDYNRAANLIVKKAECISDRNLFFALKQLADDGSYNESIANVAYELIVKSWYDKTLISIVLTYYKGSQMEWQALSRALAAMSVSERTLDEIILRNAILMHMPDAGAQRVFARMCDMDEGNPLLHDFAMYLSYEIILNGLNPSHETIARLEQLFLRGEEHFLAYALAHVYIMQDVTTIPSANILTRAVRFCEEDGILFPVFKQIKDKSMLTPYIEKHQPFVHHAAPEKTVLLAYRTDSDGAAFTEKPMRYVRFGLYMTHIAHFFDETITYCYVTQTPTGSVSSKEMMVKNSRIHLLDAPKDTYYALNEALIAEQMFKYDKVEQMITERLKPLPRLKGWIV